MKGRLDIEYCKIERALTCSLQVMSLLGVILLSNLVHAQSSGLRGRFGWDLAATDSVNANSIASQSLTNECAFERLQVKKVEDRIESLNRSSGRYMLGGKPDYQLMRHLQATKMARMQFEMNRLKRKSHGLQLCLAREAERIQKRIELEQMEKFNEERKRLMLAELELRLAKERQLAQQNERVTGRRTNLSAGSSAKTATRRPASLSSPNIDEFIIPSDINMPDGQRWVPVSQ